MARPRYSMKRHDLVPDFTVTLSDATGAVSLDGADSVRFIMVDSAGTIVVDRAPALANQNLYPGKVSVTWELGETAVVGDYEAEFEVSWPTGPQTFPLSGTILIQIEPDLG